MDKRTSLNTLYHCVYNLNYHLVLVTKYRRKVITEPMLRDLSTILSRICASWKCDLLELSGEADHVHMLISAHPNLKLSDFVNNLKTASSRRMRRLYKNHVDRFYREPVFWHRSYCIISAGGAPLSILKRYIQLQDHEKTKDA